MPMMSKASRAKHKHTKRMIKRGIPPGLAAYHAAKKAGLIPGNARKQKRAKNPASKKRTVHAMFRLVIRKPGQSLYLNADGDKFVKTGKAKLFSTHQGVLGAAQTLSEKYAGALQGWSMYAVT